MPSSSNRASLKKEVDPSGRSTVVSAPKGSGFSDATMAPVDSYQVLLATNDTHVGMGEKLKYKLLPKLLSGTSRAS